MSEGPGTIGSHLNVLFCVASTLKIGALILIADAIPILFEKPFSLKRKSPAAKPPISKRRRSAYEKRERSRSKNIFPLHVGDAEHLG